MEKDSLKSNNNVNTNNTHKTGDDLLRAVSETTKQTTSDFVLQWGNRKRLRNSENSSAMRGQSNGGVRGLASPDKACESRVMAMRSNTRTENRKAFRFELVKRNDGASNPGRRLHGCRNYKTSNYCGYFQWYDDPFLLRATQVISGLLRRIDRHDLDLQAARGKERKWMYIALCLALYIVVEKVFIR
ncbi:hypothetical protein GH714_030592 [Hevea brasiliensis]|uniref:Zinc finger GRF-type domain-containing protein n=1 Tax=Hevea brasiliensis TaxID=3981 RepID=A0A6A6LV46_HEVBR|nr:hypothetical protein GH714_030592 [Hevea brasiliensis]